ncbi:MAG: flippase-like domain-containing protein, partial [Bacteroidetes bacterium]|nr:flippase-like domain-containing protein [Bacteroidota bacterium]
MKKKIIAVFKYLVFLFIGLFLLWLVYRKLNLQLVIRQILNANYWWILLSFVFGIISHIARAIRWNILINSLGYKTKTSTTFYAVMIG